jgi:hypothetical protein
MTPVGGTHICLENWLALGQGSPVGVAEAQERAATCNGPGHPAGAGCGAELPGPVGQQAGQPGQLPGSGRSIRGLPPCGTLKNVTAST